MIYIGGAPGGLALAMHAWCGAADMDSRFRGNDGRRSKNLSPRKRGVTEAWRGEAFAFHPPPGLPPVRGEEKKGEPPPCEYDPQAQKDWEGRPVPSRPAAGVHAHAAHVRHLAVPNMRRDRRTAE